MFQNGPGAGFNAAKDRAIAHNPALVCRRVRKGTDYNFHVLNGKAIVGKGRSARDAWSDYLFQNHLMDYQ